MKTQESVKQLMRLPLHIVQQLTVTKGRNKSALVADLVFSLEERFIEFEQSPTFDNGIVIRAYGEQIGSIDVTRGKQEYKLTGDAQWSKEWWLLVDLLVIQSDRILDEMAEQAQSDYEDATDASMTDAQKLLVATHGTIGERLLANLDERFEVEIVEKRLEITDTTTNIAVLVEYNREAGTWMGYQSNGQLWAVTGKPSHHLELITKGFI